MSLRTARLARRLMRVADAQSRMKGILSRNPGVAPELLEDMASVDPTGNQGAYLDWIFKNVNLKDQSQGIHWPEDRERVRRALEGFHKLKKEPRYFKQYGASPDINTYKLRTMEGLNRKVYGQLHLQEEAPDTENLANGVALFYRDREFQVFRVGGPGTKIKEAVKALCEFGKGTGWCTEGEEAAHSYLERGPVYVIYHKGEKIAQTDGDQLMDLEDYPIKIDDNPDLWERLVDFGVFSRARFAFEYAGEVIHGRWPAGEPDLLNDATYRLAYIKKVLKFGETWPEAAPYILRDKNPVEIYHYTVKCLNSKRWPEGEKALLISTDPETPAYLVSYAKAMIWRRWPEAESRIFGSRVAYLILDYAQSCCQGQRVPEVEQALLNSDDERGDKPHSLVQYAVQVIQGRWPEIEPSLITGNGVSFLREYLDGLNLNPTQFVEEFIQKHQGKAKAGSRMTL